MTLSEILKPFIEYFGTLFTLSGVIYGAMLRYFKYKEKQAVENSVGKAAIDLLTAKNDELKKEQESAKREMEKFREEMRVNWVDCFKLLSGKQ